MYKNLYEILYDLFGLDLPVFKFVQSFGLFVALAFLAASYFFAKELKRKEKEGLLQSQTIKVLKGSPATISDLILNGFFGLLLGWKFGGLITNWDSFNNNPQEYMLSMQGNLFLGLLVAGAFAYWKYYEKKKEQLDKPKMVDEEIHPYQLVGNMTVYAAVAGFIGAKIFHNLENLDELKADPIGALTSFSGLTFYGGLIFGAAAVIWYARKHKIHILHLIDACAPALMLAYGVGRIGCQVAGDGDWGIPNDMPQPEWLSFLPEWTWAYDYPNNVLGINLKENFEANGFISETGKAWPTPLYEAIMGIGLFGVLWGIRKKIHAPGALFSIYLIMSGFERFFIEKIRVNETYKIFGAEITQAEIISVALILVGIIGVWFFRKNKEKYIQKSPL